MSGSIFDSLTDPTTSGLLGLAQGLGQAAMPSRLPVPFGAALGMGIGGMQQGAATGMALRKAQLQNAFTQNQYDAMRGQGMMGAQGGQGGSTPFGVPQMSPDGTQPLIAPGRAAFMAQLMAMNPDTARAAGPWLEMMKSGLPANGTQFLANGSVAPTPGALPSMAALRSAEAFGTKQGTEQGTMTPAPYDVQGPDPAGRMPGMPGYEPTTQKRYLLPTQAGAMASGASPPGAMPASDWASRLNGTENATGNPNAKNPLSSATGNGQFINSTWLAQVRKAYPDQTQGMSDQQVLGMRNDPLLSNQMTMAYGAENVPVLTNAGLPANATTLAAAHKLGPQAAVPVLIAARNNPATPLAAILPPEVMQANPQLQGKTAGSYVFGLSAQFGATPVDFSRGAPQAAGLAGAPETKLTPGQAASQEVAVANQKALGDAAADRTKLITTRAGVYDPVSNQEIYRQPEYHEVVDPKSGREYPAFVQPGENGQLNIMGGPPGQNGAIPPSKLGPGEHDTIEHLADQYAKEDKQKYEGATNSLFQLDQQDQNISKLNSGGGWSATGTGADAKLQWAKAINSAAQSLGVKPLFDPKKVAGWEDATKIQTQLAFAQAKQLGSREAQQVISMSRAATPGAENTPQGYQRISSGYHEMNEREVDMYRFKTGWLQSHQGNLTGAETAFNDQFKPEMYAARAISTVEPPTMTAKSAADFATQAEKYLPGTQVILNGQPKIIPARPDAPPIPAYIQQRFLQAQHAPG